MTVSTFTENSDLLKYIVYVYLLTV